MSLAYITSTTDNELIKIVSIPSDDDEDVIKTVLLIEAFVMVTPDWDKGRFIV